MSDLIHLRAVIYGRAAFDTTEKATEIFDYLRLHPQFAPTHFGAYPPLKALPKVGHRRLIEAIVNQPAQDRNPERVYSKMTFARAENPRAQFETEWARLAHKPFSESVYEAVLVPEAIPDFLTFIQPLFTFHDAYYAYITTPSDLNHEHLVSWQSENLLTKTPNENERLVGMSLEEGIPNVFWVTYFGKPYVDWFGEDKFAGLDVEVDEDDRGGRVLRLGNRPFSTRDAILAQTALSLKQQLGSDAFVELAKIKSAVRANAPLADNVQPESLQTPRQRPDLPFL